MIILKYNTVFSFRVFFEFGNPGVNYHLVAELFKRTIPL